MDLIEKIRDEIGFKITENYNLQQLQNWKKQHILIDAGEKGQSIVRINAIDELWLRPRLLRVCHSRAKRPL
jgi:hypothetical protein